MKKFLLTLFGLFLVHNIYACPDLLNSDMRILDSSDTQNLCTYEGKTLLVVNVASRCGYTYQYSGLQNLYEKIKIMVLLFWVLRDFFKNIQKKVLWLSSVQLNMELIFLCLQP